MPGNYGVLGKRGKSDTTPPPSNRTEKKQKTNTPKNSSPPSAASDKRYVTSIHFTQPPSKRKGKKQKTNTKVVKPENSSPPSAASDKSYVTSINFTPPSDKSLAKKLEYSPTTPQQDSGIASSSQDARHESPSIATISQVWVRLRKISKQLKQVDEMISSPEVQSPGEEAAQLHKGWALVRKRYGKLEVTLTKMLGCSTD